MNKLDDGMSNYASLARTFRGAYDQASKGKGKERHADDEPFQYQKICVINRWIGDSPVAGALFQAVKKTVESSRMTADRAIHELQGAINYLAAAIILLEEHIPDEEPEQEQTPRLCANCHFCMCRRDEMPCKKCFQHNSKPHFKIYVRNSGQ